MHGALICARPDQHPPDKWVKLTTAEDVSAALASLACDDPECVGSHTVIFPGERGRVHVRCVVPPPAVLARLYPKIKRRYRRDRPPPSEAPIPEWPAPDELNEDLGVPPRPSAIPARARNAALLRTTAVRQPSPTVPGEHAGFGSTWPPDANSAAQRLCSIDGCGKRHRARGLCSAHYFQLYSKPRMEAAEKCKRLRVELQPDQETAKDEMSIVDAAIKARDHADECLDPGCHHLANALEAAVNSIAEEQLSELRTDVDVSTLPSPAEAGYVEQILIHAPDAMN